MLPPNSAGTIELRLSPSAGATPTQPRNGCSGIFTVKLGIFGMKGCYVSCFVDRVRPSLFGIDPPRTGVYLLLFKAPNPGPALPNPCGAFTSIAMNFTFSMSPGSAPSI